LKFTIILIFRSQADEWGIEQRSKANSGNDCWVIDKTGLTITDSNALVKHLKLHGESFPVVGESFLGKLLADFELVGVLR
jgi:hypothetical protein